MKKLITFLFLITLFSQYGQTVSTFAGSGARSCIDANGTAATFNHPTSVSMDANGNLYISDSNNYKIRKITPTGDVSSFAGSCIGGSVDGPGATASFNGLGQTVVDASGNVYVADAFNHKIRKITPAGYVSTFAGSGSIGSVDATGTEASFSYPSGIAIDSYGNLYVGDYSNHKIRKITPTGVVTTFAGSGSVGSTDANGILASFNGPFAISIDGSGNLYIVELGNNKIRKITPAGDVTTFAGSGSLGSANGIGTAASFYEPKGITIDGSGNLYVADTGNNKIRKITPTGVVSTIAGTGVAGCNNGQGSVATFDYPSGIAVDPSGNTLFVADRYNQKIRKITGVNLNNSDIAFEEHIVVYPNPTSGIFNLMSKEVYHLQVYDDVGKLILSQNNSTSILDLRPFQSGLYFIKLIDEKNQTKTVKIIKE